MSAHAGTGEPDVTTLVVALAEVLTARGFTVSVRASTGDVLSARNRAADARTGNPLGVVLSPGLVQTVACRPHADGGLWWHWVWLERENDAPEYEPLCPAAEVETAAERIGRVLAVGDGS